MKRETVIKVITVPCNLFHQARACPHTDLEWQGDELEMTGISGVVDCLGNRLTISELDRSYRKCWSRTWCVTEDSCQSTLSPSKN